MPTAADHKSDDFNDKPRLRSVPHEPAPGPGKAELPGAENTRSGFGTTLEVHLRCLAPHAGEGS